MTLNITSMGEGSPLVLIHGYGTSNVIWDPVREILAQHFSVRAVDLPGYGESPYHASLQDLKQLASFIAEQIQEPSIILGWSFGGLVATQLALLYPQKVSHLVNVGSTPKFNADRISWHAGIYEPELHRFGEMMQSAPESTLSNFIELQLRGAALSDDAKIKLLETLKASTPDSRALAQTLQLLAKTDLRPQLHQLTMPVLYLFGDKDVFIPLESIAQIQAAHPKASIIVMERATHSPFLSRPEIFAKHLVQFASGISNLHEDTNETPR